MSNQRITLPLLPLRDVVAFPGVSLPLFVGRYKSMQSINMVDDRVFLLAQKDPQVEDPKRDDLYDIGVVARIKQSVVLPDQSMKIFVDGEATARLIDLIDKDDVFSANVELIENVYLDSTPDVLALRKMLCATFDQYMKMQRRYSAELSVYMTNIDDSFKLVYISAMHVNLKASTKQKLLEECNEKQLIEFMVGLIEGEMEIFQAERRIRTRIKSQIEKNQKEYYLNEQMKAIQHELGEADDFREEVRNLEKKLEALKLSESTYTRAKSEIKKLKYMSPFSAETAIVRGYLELLLNLPWGKFTEMNTDIEHVKKELEESHYGMKKAKERLYELIIQYRRVKDITRSPVLCFYGPPGTGKTSLAQAAGAAMGLKTVRIPLGGVRDEAVLRGHRRTYIGAQCGKLIQAMKDAQSSNLVVIFDEIGGIGYDHKGNLEDVLLEVLDPKQNNKFHDHYLDLEEGYDLSKIIFMATTNTLDLKEPLLDRLEIIEVSGYTPEEKRKIGRDYFVPRLMKEYGVEKKQFDIKDDQIDQIISEYTYEAGVRGLEQRLASLMRKTMCKLEETKCKKIVVDQTLIKTALGHPINEQEAVEVGPQIGVVTGLAYVKKREGQEGEVLYIEAKIVPGDGKIECTGRLGEVMKESAQVAFKYLLANAAKYEIDTADLQKKNIHIHLPAGAVPKDGPSAGVALFCAMLSAIKGKPIRNDVAITGEISLYKVLKVGGIKEKVLAAYRRNPRVNIVCIPNSNMSDVEEVPNYVKENIKIVPISQVDDVLQYIF